MAKLVEGLHHVTFLSAGAARTDAFMLGTLGLRRVKRTVNRDQRGGYHLFYGLGDGVPGTVLSSVAFANLARGRAGVGEVGTTILAVPVGSLPYWRDRLEAGGFPVLGVSRVGEYNRLWFEGPEGEGLAFQVADDHPALGQRGGDAPPAVLGLYGVSLRLRDTAPLGEMLGVLGFELVEDVDGVMRLNLPSDRPSGANAIELESIPDGPDAEPGAGSVHHLAFAVEDRSALDEVASRLSEVGHAPTAPIEGPYFSSVFVRAPGGVLVEFATRGPGFASDEPAARLGDTLVLPAGQEGSRDAIERTLEPLET